MVATILFQPTLLDCWQCRDLKRFRLVLKGSGGIHLSEKQQQQQQQHQHHHQGSLSTSYSRSPGYSLGSAGGHSTVNAPCPPGEVNRRDHLGRTVLHLIATSSEPVSVDYLTALLAHPSVNVNLQDHENGWTPLHRALYHGNLLTALTLLKRTTPADCRVKDFEGLTPFDLYNSTVHGTNPTPVEAEGGELYTWGANRNYTLGLGNSDDRALPDRVSLRRSEPDIGSSSRAQREPGTRFDRIKVKDVAMNKFATVVLTAEKQSNVWVCGIGTNGRIGRAPQTQANLEPLRDFHETASSISMGPDHTCIVTENGEVFTFGYNRFSQLGYSLENGQGIVSSTGSTRGIGGAASATFGAATSNTPNSELDVQISPRKVLGQLKREQVLGVAAGKLHTAAFTADALYTWGTNNGQMGYDHAATPVQITPRKVTSISSSQRIQSVAVTDFATACLLANGDVLLLHNDTSFFVRFPQPGFSSDMSVFRPRQARPKPSIQKLVAGPNNSIAAISDMGDLWQFTAEHPSEYAQPSGSTAKANIRPQLIWSVRKNKKIGAAKDVALGSGSDLILVTESGHVFVRSKKSETTNSASGMLSGSGGGKGKSGWRPIPFLQRVSRVATNESGGLAAIKSDAKVREIRARGRALHEDLQDLLPHLKAYSSKNAKEEENDIVGTLADAVVTTAAGEEGEDDDDSSEADSDVESTGQRYIAMAQIIAEAARRWSGAENEDAQRYGPHNVHLPPFGCDMFLIAGNRYLPCHRAIISARLPALAAALQNPGEKAAASTARDGIVIKQAGKAVTMTLQGCSFGSALFLLHYLYTDDLPPVWTASVGMRMEKIFSSVKLQPSLIHTQLKQLAVRLDLPALLPSLESPVPSAPAPTLSKSLEQLFTTQVEAPVEQSAHHDVQLHFADRVVPAHSVLLRRSPFFAALFQPDWTSARWNEGVISIDMSHVEWQVARIVLLHLYTDKQAITFAGTDADRSPDEFIDFVVEVLSLSNEMLLSKFKMVCSNLLRKRLVHSNVAALLTDADFYNAISLKEALMDYIARTMETLLESNYLDSLEPRMIKDLTRCVREKQDERLHRKAREEYIDGLIVKHQDYFFSLDLPAPSLGVAAARVPKRQPRSSPILAAVDSRAGKSSSSRPSSSPFTSPHLRPLGNLQSTPGQGNDSGMLMFSMDDEEGDLGAAAAEGEWQQTRQRGHRASPALEDASNFSLPPARRPSTTPWKSRTVEAERAASSPVGTPPASSGLSFDLRSIMAAEQSHRRPTSSSPSVTPSGAITPNRGPSSQAEALPVSLLSASKLSQKDRKKQLLQSQTTAQAPPTPPASTQSSAPAQSPWTTPAKQSTGAPTPLRPAMASLQSPPQQAPLPAGKMGPTYTPTRMPPRPVSQRRTVSSAATNEGSGAASVWTAPTPANGANIAALSTSPGQKWTAAEAGGGPSSWTQKSPDFGPALGSTSSLLSRNTPAPATKSFADIQAEELQRYERVNALQSSNRSKSFAQLQEEDRLENERQREEAKKKEEFERWFEEESRRLKREEQQQQQQKAKSKGPAGGKKGKAGKGKKGEGGAPPSEGQPATKAGPGNANRGAGGSAKGKGKGGGASNKAEASQQTKEQQQGPPATDS